jgi:hypothetical protein
MAVCEHCGNEYDKSFQVIMGGKTHNFDSFECAIHALAPPLIAASRSWATAWRKTAHFSAATTAPKRKECKVCAIGSSPGAKLRQLLTHWQSAGYRTLRLH